MKYDILLGRDNLTTLRAKFLQRCRDLCLNLQKCEFLREKVHYLGHVISRDGISPNLEKIEIIETIQLPKIKNNYSRLWG